MPLDTQNDGPQPVKTPGSDAYQPYVPGHLAAASIELVERILRHSLTSLENHLGETLQAPVSATLDGARQVQFSAVLDQAEPGGCMVALDLAPLPGYFLLDFPPALLFHVLDILLASPPDASASARTSVTEIELHILREFFDVFLKSLHDAWEPVYPVSLKLISMGIEETRQALNGSKAEVALATRVSLSIGDVQAFCEIAVPGFLARIATIHARDQTNRQASPAPVQENLLHALARATVRVDAVLQGASVRMGDLVAMRQGQILLLGTPPGSPFDCLINGKAQFKGDMVATGNRQGFQIE